MAKIIWKHRWSGKRIRKFFLTKDRLILIRKIFYNKEFKSIVKKIFP